MSGKKVRDPKTGWHGSIDAKAGRHARFFVEDLVVDYTRNYARACLYRYKGQPCCFSAKEEHVRELQASLLSEGQVQPILVYADGLGRPVVHAGFRRVFAFSLLADAGKAEQIPGSDGGRITALKIAAPKSPEEHLAAAQSNLHENMRRPPSAVDIAFTLRRFALDLDEHGEFGLGRLEAGRRIAAVTGQPLSVTQVGKYLQLLALSPAVLGQVHRGETTMSAALAEASKKGEGRARGPQAGIRRAEMRRLADHLPPQLREYTMYICGASDEEPEVVRRAREKLAASTQVAE